MIKRTWILYGVYAVVVAVFFLYYLFPSQSLKNYIVERAGRVNPDYHLAVEKVELVFPYRIRLHNVDLNRYSDQVLEAEEVTITPRLRSLISRKSVFAFSMNAHQGHIRGTADIADGQRLMLNAVASGIQLADIPFLSKMSSSRVEGILEGTLSYAAGNGRIEALNVNLEISQVTVALAAPFFTLENIRFDTVQADASLQNRQLKIPRVTLTGDQIQGNLSGFASIGNDAQDTSVSLSGSVMPQEQFMQRSGFQLPPSYLESLKAGGGIPVRISGPLDDLRLETK